MSILNLYWLGWIVLISLTCCVVMSRCVWTHACPQKTWLVIGLVCVARFRKQKHMHYELSQITHETLSILPTNSFQMASVLRPTKESIRHSQLCFSNNHYHFCCGLRKLTFSKMFLTIKWPAMNLFTMSPPTKELARLDEYKYLVN